MEHIQTGAQIGLQTEYYTGGEKAIKIIWDRIKKNRYEQYVKYQIDVE